MAYGLDKAIIEELNWEKATQNIVVDTRSDFIIAPHLDLIFDKQADTLVSRMKSNLLSGKYEPALPITISVPKLGILTRPGSILLPFDRLIYQALVEDMFDKIEENTDRNRSFSHLPSSDKDYLFEPTHLCWEKFQNQISNICDTSEFVLETDISNFFDTLSQHKLINLLSSAGARPESVRLLEDILSALMQKSSQGIVQGIFPSDVLGNYYLTDVDALFAYKDLPSGRYVDDIFVGFKSRLEAKQFTEQLISHLRKNGLHLNGSKTHITDASSAYERQNEIELLFEDVRNNIQDAAFDMLSNGYGFQGDWINESDEDEILDGEKLEFATIENLIIISEDNAELADKVDRFVFPILRASGNDLGIDRAFSGLKQRPHLTRQYFSYLNYFAKHNKDVRDKIENLILENGFYLDYQRMYYLAGLLSADKVSSNLLNHVSRWYDDKNIGTHTLAIIAIFLCKFGSPQTKSIVRNSYDNQNPYVQAAIMYSAQFFTGVEKRTLKRAWGGHSELNALIAEAI